MPRDPSAEAIDETSELHLLTNVQAYLEIRSVGGLPESLLVGAWNEFYKFYNRLLRRFAFVCGVKRGDIDDCVQTVWTKAVVKLPDFQYKGTCRGLRDWFFTLVKNQAIDHVRQEIRHPTANQTDALEARPDPHTVDSQSDEAYEERWRREMVWVALDELRKHISDLSYRVFYTHWIDGLSVQEIAAELKLTPRKVSYRLCRVQKKFRILFHVYAGYNLDGLTQGDAAEATSNILQPVRATRTRCT